MISQSDRKILRGLAKKVAHIADLPVMSERREMWKKHNALKRVRPMILVYPDNSWREILTDSVLQCEDRLSREIEWELRRRIFQYESINDDAPIEKTLKVYKKTSGIGKGEMYSGVDWGVNVKRHLSTQETGAYGFDPVLKEFADIKKLKVPEIVYDEAATQKELEVTMDALGDILDIQLKGICHVSFHFMYYYIHLRGYEQMMYDLYDEPKFVHEVLSFFEEGYNSIIKQCTQQNLFSLNNDDTYQSTGGFGYSTELPQPDFNPERVRPIDMWASAESQEMAQISPEQHEEFAMQYERRMLSQFGLNGYGCCDALTYKLNNVFSMPNMRRISISPWANVDICAEKLNNNYIFSWKPDPVYLSGIEFNPELIQKYIRHTLDVTKDCVPEIILTDTNTCHNEPERFTQWVKIIRELIKQY